MPDSVLPETIELKPVDWARIAQVYQTEEKLAVIASEYGLTVQKIVAHAQREGWLLRYERQQATKQKRSPGSTDPATLRKRLTALVERQIAEIEGRLAEAGESRDHERDARTLSNLTRTLDKLIELKRAAAAERAEAKRIREEASGNDSAKTDDALRHDLARRLARIAAASTN
ncbi:MAG: hypothetical protein CMI60_03405 [Parvibaculum sp.]|nr:hypothetical protein [Parvibaculum sp.]|tara:strand:+ start:1315 stop:1833 length:519 start_codon:yes stop_codon:yes gene_type:complete